MVRKIRARIWILCDFMFILLKVNREILHYLTYNKAKTRLMLYNEHLRPVITRGSVLEMLLHTTT